MAQKMDPDEEKSEFELMAYLVLYYIKTAYVKVNAAMSNNLRCHIVQCKLCFSYHSSKAYLANITLFLISTEASLLNYGNQLVS
jgi:hypothetical protein